MPEGKGKPIDEIAAETIASLHSMLESPETSPIDLANYLFTIQNDNQLKQGDFHTELQRQAGSNKNTNDQNYLIENVTAVKQFIDAYQLAKESKDIISIITISAASLMPSQGSNSAAAAGVSSAFTASAREALSSSPEPDNTEHLPSPGQLLPPKDSFVARNQQKQGSSLSRSPTE